MVGGLVFVRTRIILKANIYNELTLSVKGVAGKVSAFIDGKKGRALDFCSDGVIKDGLTYYDPDDPEVNALIKNTNEHLIKNKLSLDPYLEDILILNLKGRVVFSTNGQWLGRDKSQKDYFRVIAKYFRDGATLKKLQNNPALIVYVSDFYSSGDLGRPVLAISNIVAARRTGLPLGVLVNRYRGDSFDKFLKAEREAIGASGKVYMVNKKGFLLTVPRFFLSRADEVVLKKRIESLPLIKAQENTAEVLGIYKDFRGKNVLAASMLMDKNDWIILAEEDAEKVFSPLYRLTMQIFIIGMISLCVVAGVSFLIARLERNIANKTKELEDSRAQMLQAGKMAAVGQMASGIAHGINNPLTGVLNNVQLIKMSLDEKGPSALNDHRRLLDTIEESALRCVKVSRSLLDFSRASEEKFQPLSLNEVVNRVIALVENEMRARGTSLRKELQPDLPLVRGDFQLLSQVIFDLLNNSQYAISKKTGKEAGRILIKTEFIPQEERVSCVISDNGIGIPEENLGKLFVPFFTTKPQGEGTGLGLSICHSIIMRHKGYIAAESRFREGASFRIKLPVFRKEEKDEPRQSA